MTFKEITDKLYNLKLNPPTICNNYWMTDYGYEIEDGTSEGEEIFQIHNDKSPKEVLKENFGEVKCVFHYGGEGQGDSWKEIYHFIEYNIYIMFSAYYDSHHGVYWADMSIDSVEPYEKIITEYKIIKNA